MDEYILITGASGKIGRTLAKSLSHNYQLILCGTNEEKLGEVHRTCGDGKHIIWNCDLSKTENIAESLERIIRDNAAKVSGFVHLAGIAPLMPLHMISVAEMKKIMDVNLFSAVEISKVLVKKKVNSKYLKNIVLVSSISSIVGTKGMSIYSASKGAIDAFARSLAHELAPGVRVNTVLPGGMLVSDDDFVQNHGGDSDSGYLLGAGHVEDISSMIEYLLSTKAKWITGQNFVVDGGRTFHY